METNKYYGHPRFYTIIEELKRIHSNKNHDYSSGHPLSNFYECEGFGVNASTGLMVRLSDKWSRLKSYFLKGELLVKDEGVGDTLSDLAAYAILLKIVLEEEKKKETPLQSLNS